MGIFHYLNVLNGDCSIIQHPSGRVTVVDVYNASIAQENISLDQRAYLEVIAERANYNQKKHPVNPINYLKDFGISEVHRFIVTHPDMDHIGGIKDFFDTFGPANFWDTDNTCEKDFDGVKGPHSEEDWEYYKNLRDTDPQSSPKRLTLYSGASGKFFNKNEDGDEGSDGLHVLAPTKELVSHANECGDFNDASYVLLYRSAGGRILLSGDSHDRTWEHILENHADDIANVDLLIAPHHGRHSNRSYEFLSIVNPALTFFGNASSEHLAYKAWSNRGLPIYTNNECGTMIVDTNSKPMSLYVTNETFARAENPYTFYSVAHKGYFVKTFGHNT